MPVHIGEITSEVTFVSGELPLTEAQIEKLVKLIMRRLQDHEKEAKQRSAATKLRRESQPPSNIHD